MPVRTLNIIGVVMTGVGLLLALAQLTVLLFNGTEGFAVTAYEITAAVLIVAGTLLAYIPDPTYRTPLRGMNEVNPVRLAYASVIFLFGFLLFTVVALFLFFPVARLTGPLYVGAGTVGAVMMFFGGRFLFIEPNGSVHIPAEK